jgi:hypothetical protein
MGFAGPDSRLAEIAQKLRSQAQQYPISRSWDSTLPVSA